MKSLSTSANNSSTKKVNNLKGSLWYKEIGLSWFIINFFLQTLHKAYKYCNTSFNVWYYTQLLTWAIICHHLVSHQCNEHVCDKQQLFRCASIQAVQITTFPYLVCVMVHNNLSRVNCSTSI